MQFKSNNSKDHFLIKTIKDSYKCIFELIQIDNLNEHISLLNIVIQNIKDKNIKWIEINFNIKPIIPENTICYKNMNNNYYVCHVADFFKFYFKNIINCLNRNKNLIYIDNIIKKDGWTEIINKKEYRIKKFLELKESINKLSSSLKILDKHIIYNE